MRKPLNTKKVLLSIPAQILALLDGLASKHYQTRSAFMVSLVRKAAREEPPSE